MVFDILRDEISRLAVICYKEVFGLDVVVIHKLWDLTVGVSFNSEGLQWTLKLPCCNHVLDGDLLNFLTRISHVVYRFNINVLVYVRHFILDSALDPRRAQQRIHLVALQINVRPVMAFLRQIANRQSVEYV